MTLKEMLYNSDGTRKAVSFVELSNNSLWYETEDNFLFPVPLEETSGTVLKAYDFAPVFMQWIRKHKELIDSGKDTSNE